MSEFNDILHSALQEAKKKTNADRIRAMTDDELADMFDKEVSGGVICPPNHTHKYCAAGDCQKCWLDWLKQEAK